MEDQERIFQEIQERHAKNFHLERMNKFEMLFNILGTF